MIHPIKQKIVVLAHGLTAGGGLSVGANIISCLNDSTCNIEYTFILPNISPYNEINYKDTCNIIWYENNYSAIGRWLFDIISIPRIIKAIKPDWILGLGNLGVPSVDSKQAILFHKPQLIYPQKYSVNEVWTKKIKNQAIKLALKNSLRHTKIVFCQTETAGNRFRDTFDYQGLISIWPNAVSNKVKSNVESDITRIPEQLKAWKMTDNATIDFFVLTRYYPHKNLELLLDACKRYRSKLKNVRFFITVESSQHPMAHKLLADISSNDLEDMIINIGPLKQEELAEFYTHMDALLLPTLLESFSGTYLEAMEFKKPIVTSRLDFAKELCGDAALYFDPWSTEDFVSTINQFCADNNLRDILVSKGEKQRLQYSHNWKTTTSNVEKILLEFDG